MPKTDRPDDELRPLFTDEEEQVSSILMGKGDENPKEESELKESDSELKESELEEDKNGRE